MSELHKSARGKIVDMNRLSSQNELTVAVSNVKINARGDELGPGGKIIRSRTESTYVGVPVESPLHNSYNHSRPHPQVTNPAAIEVPELVTDAPIALVQPAPSLKEEKLTKGKQ